MSAKASNRSYVCFSLSGDDFDPQLVTESLGIKPTHLKRKEEVAKGNRANYSRWELHSQTTEYLNMDNLVDEVVNQLYDKVKLICSVKDALHLESVLEIVLYIDTNEETSMPFLGHDLATITFLYETQTRTDVDIFRFDSKSV